MTPTQQDAVRGQVRDRYAEVANAGGGCCGGSTCSTPVPVQLPKASEQLGYSKEEVQAAPEGANLGLGCGNPQAIADLKEGETVLDLGSGAGFDCFLAARQVGENGKVIGVDMTPDMLAKAKKNAESGGYANVEFRLGEIEHLPVADNSVDAVISNCVINLSPEKPQVFAEAFRALRPGGRLAVSDIVAIRELPQAMRCDPDAICSCIGGAPLLADLQRMLQDAGFADIQVDLREESREFIKEWYPGSGAEKYVRSAAIQARKATD